MTIDFYYAEWSPPCQTVQLLAAILNIKLNPIHTTPSKGDTQKLEFRQMNPQHSIPTIVDKGFVLSESRAICKYLTEKYAPESGKFSREQLYPRSVKGRAIVDQRLDFDLGALYRRVSEYFGPAITTGYFGKSSLPKLNAALEILDTYLGKTKWVASDDFTLADVSALVTISCLEVSGYDLTAYYNIIRWVDTAQSSVPHYNEVITIHGATAFKEFLLSKLKDSEKIEKL